MTKLKKNNRMTHGTLCCVFCFTWQQQQQQQQQTQQLQQAY
jgi:hypothetical protein